MYNYVPTDSCWRISKRSLFVSHRSCIFGVTMIDSYVDLSTWCLWATQRQRDQQSAGTMPAKQTLTSTNLDTHLHLLIQLRSWY